MFKASKSTIGFILGLGLVYPLGKFWYIGVIIGLFLIGWGTKEGADNTEKGRVFPMHKIASLILLVVILANVVKLFII